MFRAFCDNNHVETLPPRDDELQEDYDRLLWRIGAARKTVFK
jgi:hypothetical protein